MAQLMVDPTLSWPRKLRRHFGDAADAALTLHIAHFVFRLSANIRSDHLSVVLERFGTLPRPRAQNPVRGYERIARLRNRLLRLPFFSSYNTCYVRALTLYRFLDGCGSRVEVHFGIEEVPGRMERLRGHAWVTVDGATIEGPDALIAGRVRPIAIRSISEICGR